MAATARNFRIFRLRGLWWQLGPLSPERMDAVRLIVDDQLRELGAEPEAGRKEKRNAELYAKLEREQSA
ncbi:MAG: hypothetical protein ACK4ZW_08380 [Blastomonas sp.]